MQSQTYNAATSPMGKKTHALLPFSMNECDTNANGHSRNRRNAGRLLVDYHIPAKESKKKCQVSDPYQVG
jgi:hypothetical protein